MDLRGNPNVHPSLRFGHVSDPLGHLVTPASHLIGAAPAKPLPRSVDFSKYAVIRDQLKTGSCVGHAIVGAVETRLAARGTPVDHHSPVCAYDAGRCIDRVPNADGSLPALLDHGTMPNAAHRGITQWGVCPYELRPTDNATINNEPSFAELQSAAKWKLSGYYGILSIGQLRTTQVMQALAAGYCVAGATFADENMQDYDGSKGPLGMPDFNDPNGGGHYIYLCGYEITSSGVVVVTFANSWSEEWGLSGFGQGDPAFLGSMSDLYIEEAQLIA